MTPAAIAAIIGLVQEAIAEAPALAASLKKLFSSDNPTPADFDALKAAVLAESYESFVPGTSIPPS